MPHVIELALREASVILHFTILDLLRKAIIALHLHLNWLILVQFLYLDTGQVQGLEQEGII